MQNEIEVRTNKEEYSPGDHICGAVYLRIINPTAGTGVQLRFHGYAKFEYVYKAGEHPAYREQKDYVNYPYQSLFHQEPLSIGNKLFPFKIELSKDIPGTFKAHGETRLARWETSVEYILEVEVTHAAELKKAMPIVILQPPDRNVDMKAHPRAVSTQLEITRFLLLTDVISITARLHDHIHRTGEVIKVRVIITNNSRIPVQSLRLKLLRRIIFMCKLPVLEDYADDECVDASGEALDICVEKDMQVGREQLIDVSRGNELDSILFPLKETDGTPVCPTVRCSCVECGYRVCITANLANGSSFDTYVPVPVINAAKNRQWRDWDPPFWLTDDDMETVLSDNCRVGVPDNLLYTEAFSSIPGFQPL